MNASCVHEYGHRKLLVKSIVSKSMDEEKTADSKWS